MASENHKCYLCGNDLKGDIDDDHIPPRQFYAKSIRTKHSPNLLTIPVHRECNRSYQLDEDYFVHSLVPLAGESYSGGAALLEKTKKYHEGRDVKLIGKILREFEDRPSGLVLPHGKVVKRYDGNRIRRITWKIVRGLFYHRNKIVLPEDKPHSVEIYGPDERPKEIYDQMTFQESLGDYPGVFDYTYADYSETNNIIVWAILLWDKIIMFIPFHVIGCSCKRCEEVT